MSIPAGNGATGASDTGPALGYTLNLFWFNFLFMLISKNNMNTCTYLIHTLSLIYAMKLLVIFGIKIYRKLPSYLTQITSLLFLRVGVQLDGGCCCKLGWPSCPSISSSPSCLPALARQSSSITFIQACNRLYGGRTLHSYGHGMGIMKSGRCQKWIKPSSHSM